MKRLELGVFLPVGKNGFIKSTNSPAYIPSYKDNLEITLLAEELGLDWVFSMAKWRGFGGNSHFWDSALESFSLMSALAAATSRIALISTVNPLIYHPVLMAKMAATVDDVSGGRLGLNLITGSTLGEYEQMGILPGGYDTDRYLYATEWVQVLKRLWSEPSVTHHGTYFHLDDCVSEPKPVQEPHPFLVCAGTSDEGLRFTAREANYSFISGKDLPSIREMATRAKGFASQHDRNIKSAVSKMLVIGETKSEAESYWEHLMDGADLEAIKNAGVAYSNSTRERNKERGAEMLADRSQIAAGRPLIGDPTEVAQDFIELAKDGNVDCVLLVFPDYLEGLKLFGSEVLPRLRKELDVGLQFA